MRPSGRSPVTHSVVMTEVMSVPELVMKALVPLIFQDPSDQHGLRTGRAGVGAAARLGQPERPERSPAASAGSHCCRCSSEPKR